MWKDKVPVKRGECWNEVDWGYRRDMPTPQDGKRQCVAYHASHALSTKNTYCVFPSGVQVHTHGLRSNAPIHTVKEDGGAHDPRYKLTKDRVSYPCGQLRSTSGTFPCGVALRTCDLHITDESVLVHRKDDHNPFFMVSLVLNLWMMQKQHVQIIMWDDAGPQPVDDIFTRMWGKKLLYANALLEKTICFDAPLWTIPNEYTGPLMMHLNDAQQCQKSSMIEAFVKDVHALYPIPNRHGQTVTFVGRRHYNKRTIGRVWTNEREIVEALTKARPDLNVRLVYYEDITFEEQMHTDRTTDIMVGMHGAGLVHALFMERGSHVVEVFPRHKRRWGYRNIAQYRGFTYDDFRGGRDGAHESKTMPVQEWLTYWEKRFQKKGGTLSKGITTGHGENKITDRILTLVPNGTVFVEMGANDGLNSNTHLLEQLGWSGLCIEAGSTNFGKLQRNRPVCTNVNAVVSEKEAEVIFREFPSGILYGHSGLKDSRSDVDWHSLISTHQASFIDHSVRTMTMQTIFIKYGVTDIDYFSLDVEGAEMLILRNYPFEMYPVRVWSIESNKLDRMKLVTFMDGKGYRCEHYDGTNTICERFSHKSIQKYKRCISSSIFLPDDSHRAKYKATVPGAVASAAKLLPDWQILIYYDDSVSSEFRRKVDKAASSIVWIKKNKNIGRDGTFWRFEAIGFCQMVIFRDIEMKWYQMSDVWAIRDFEARKESLGYIQLVHQRGVCHAFETKKYGRCRRQTLGGVYMMKKTSFDMKTAISNWHNRAEFGQDEYFLTEIVHPIGNSVVYYDPVPKIKASVYRSEWNETYIEMPIRWGVEGGSVLSTSPRERLTALFKGPTLVSHPPLSETTRILVAQLAVSCDPVRTTRGYDLCVYPRGEDLISDRLRASGSWENDLLVQLNRFLSQYPDSLFIDVGANIGSWSVDAAHQGHDVVAFEPLWGNYERMVGSFKHNNLTALLFPIGVAEDFGVFTFRTHANNYGANRMIRSNRSSGVFGVDFGVGHRLDQVLRTVNGRDLILKIDVEGMDCAIVVSMDDFFRRNQVRALFMVFHLKSMSTCSDPDTWQQFWSVVERHSLSLRGNLFQKDAPYEPGMGKNTLWISKNGVRTGRPAPNVDANDGVQDPLLIDVGGIAGEGDNFVITNKDTLDITNEQACKRFLNGRRVTAYKSEHVFEHFTESEALSAAKNMFKSLVPGGYARIAVPDGFLPSAKYQEHIKLGSWVSGFGPGHQVVWNIHTLSGVFRTAGFRIHPLEYWSKTGYFHSIPWKDSDGVIKRSTHATKKTMFDDIPHTSLLIDAFKPLPQSTAVSKIGVCLTGGLRRTGNAIIILANAIRTLTNGEFLVLTGAWRDWFISFFGEHPRVQTNASGCSKRLQGGKMYEWFPFDEINPVIPTLLPKRSIRTRAENIYSKGTFTSVHGRWLGGECFMRANMSATFCHGSELYHHTCEQRGTDFPSNATVVLFSDQERPDLDKTFSIVDTTIFFVQLWSQTLSETHYGNPMSSLDYIVAHWRHYVHNKSTEPLSCYRHLFIPFTPHNTPHKDTSLETFHDRFSGGGMNRPEQALLARTYANAVSVFEWGMGSSTLIAAHVGIKQLTAVDSAPTWVNKVRSILNRPQYTFRHADIGPVIQFGNPKDQSRKDKWPDYSLQVTRESESFDVYVVDGRFRVACACQAMLHGRADSLVMIHDFGRDAYQVLLTLADKVEQVRVLAGLRRKTMVSDKDIQAVWQQYKFIQT
jgi:FkbM family methyltransferase